MYLLLIQLCAGAVSDINHIYVQRFSSGEILADNNSEITVDFEPNTDGVFVNYQAKVCNAVIVEKKTGIQHICSHDVIYIVNTNVHYLKLYIRFSSRISKIYYSAATDFKRDSDRGYIIGDPFTDVTMGYYSTEQETKISFYDGETVSIYFPSFIMRTCRINYSLPKSAEFSIHYLDIKTNELVDMSLEKTKSISFSKENYGFIIRFKVNHFAESSLISFSDSTDGKPSSGYYNEYTNISSFITGSYQNVIDYSQIEKFLPFESTICIYTDISKLCPKDMAHISLKTFNEFSENYIADEKNQPLTVYVAGNNIGEINFYRSDIPLNIKSAEYTGELKLNMFVTPFYLNIDTIKTSWIFNSSYLSFNNLAIQNATVTLSRTPKIFVNNYNCDPEIRNIFESVTIGESLYINEKTWKSPAFDYQFLPTTQLVFPNFVKSIYTYEDGFGIPNSPVINVHRIKLIAGKNVMIIGQKNQIDLEMITIEADNSEVTLRDIPGSTIVNCQISNALKLNSNSLCNYKYEGRGTLVVDHNTAMLCDLSYPKVKVQYYISDSTAFVISDNDITIGGLRVAVTSYGLELIHNQQKTVNVFLANNITKIPSFSLAISGGATIVLGSGFKSFKGYGLLKITASGVFAVRSLDSTPIHSVMISSPNGALVDAIVPLPTQPQPPRNRSGAIIFGTIILCAVAIALVALLALSPLGAWAGLTTAKYCDCGCGYEVNRVSSDPSYSEEESIEP